MSISSNLPQFSISDMLEAGVHYGHKTYRWKPDMAPYLYGEKDGIHIIDLQTTAPLLRAALKAIYEVVKSNGRVLFVATKVQASDLIAEYASQCGQYYVNHRWLGGMLTNWNTISKSIKRLESIEKILEDEEVSAGYTKKEILNFTRQRDKLEKALGGIRNMGGKPDLLVVIDTNREKIAIQEAASLNIPIVAVVDSNSNPNNIDYIIPGNDDAIRANRFYCELFNQAALAGIESSLTASGVDLGELAEDGTKFSASKKVAKINNNKVSRLDNSQKIVQEQMDEQESDDNA